MNKTVLISVIIAILVIITAGMALILTGILPLNSPEEQAAAAPEQAATTTRPAPIYIRLDPAFTVSFTDDEEAQFLQLALDVATNDEDVEKAIAQHMPAIRNALVMLFSSQKAADLRGRTGKEKLRRQALEEIKRVLEELAGKTDVKDVFFTSFMMQ